MNAPPSGGSGPPLLELRNVTVMRGHREALRAVDLRVDAGERVAVLGPNGSGKSTLVKTLTREAYPVASDDSSLRILGQERWNVFDLRARLGIVSPDVLAACTTDATVRDVVVSGFFSSTRVFAHHAVGPELYARADAALARLGIAHLSDRPVVTLSSGEAKRTLVARALAHDPQTLVFDEAGSALDLGAQARLTQALRTLARAGLGLVLVTHHVSEIIPEIDRVVLLGAGRIVADGPKRDVLTAARLGSLFGVEVHLVEHDGFFHAYASGPDTA